MKTHSEHTRRLISLRRKQFFINHPEIREQLKTRYSIICQKCGITFNCATTTKKLCSNCSQNWKTCKKCNKSFIAKPYQKVCDKCIENYTCACGCGEKIAINKKFKNGHNSFKHKIITKNLNLQKYFYKKETY